MRDFYTADDEEPNCLRCDNLMLDDSSCALRCGPTHSWQLYMRLKEFKEDFNFSNNVYDKLDMLGEL